MWLQEKAAIEEQCQKQVLQIQASAEKGKQATESKVASIIDRLHGLAEKESSREQQRGLYRHPPSLQQSSFCQISPSCSLLPFQMRWISALSKNGHAE